MHPGSMRLFVPTFISLGLLFYSCTADPAVPGEEKGGPPETEFALVDGLPHGTVAFDGVTPSGYRLEFLGDSVRTYTPFGFNEKRMRAYAADSSARYPDSLYLTYQIGADSALAAVIRPLGAAPVRQQYRPVKKLVYRELPENGMQGQTYRITIDSTDYVMYFEETTGSRGSVTSTLRVMKLLTLEEDPGRRVTNYRTAFGFDGRMVVPITGGNRGYPTREERNVLSVSYSTDGRLQGYLLRGQDGSVEGPIFTDTLTSVIPDSVPNGRLLEILNTGRISVGQPPPEPDSIGIEYSNLNGEGDDHLLTYADLDRLDFEFAEDGDYTLFAGPRMIAQGKWTFSEGRQIIDIKARSSMQQNANLIEAYTPRSLTFSLPVQLRTREPRGVRLTSYYTPRVRVTFELPDAETDLNNQ